MGSNPIRATRQFPYSARNKNKVVEASVYRELTHMPGPSLSPAERLDLVKGSNITNTTMIATFTYIAAIRIDGGIDPKPYSEGFM